MARPSTDEERARWREKSAQRYAANRVEILSSRHAKGIPCRGCGTPRTVVPKDRERTLAEGGPLCHACRRAETERLRVVEERIRTERIAKKEARPPRDRRKGSGRSGTGASRYRRNRLIVLGASDLCGICGHPGAATVDHIISAKAWTGTKQMFDDVSNLQPAHGSLGSLGLVNRCATCGKLCNQTKGAKRYAKSPTGVS